MLLINMDTKERIKEYNEIVKYIKKCRSPHIKKVPLPVTFNRPYFKLSCNNNSNDFITHRIIMTAGADAEVWAACLYKSLSYQDYYAKAQDFWASEWKIPYCVENSHVYIKVIPLKGKYITSEVKNEISIAKKCNKLVLSQQCINYNIYYGKFFIKMNKDNYYNAKIKEKYYDTSKIEKLRDTKSKKYKKYLNLMESKYKNYGRNALFIINEFSRYDLKFWIFQNFQSTDIGGMILSLLFQIVFAIHCIQTNQGILHLDLHSRNVLVSQEAKKDKANQYLKYKVGKQVYYIPSHGYLAKLWDFGRSYNINTKKAKESIIKQGKRFFQYDFDTENISKIEKNMKTKAILHNVFMFDIWRLVEHIKIVIEEVPSHNKSIKKVLSTLDLMEIESRKIWKNNLINGIKYNNNIELFIKKYFKGYTTKHKKNVLNKTAYYI